jgi:hypothetical protein
MTHEEDTEMIRQTLDSQPFLSGQTNEQNFPSSMNKI